VAYQMSKYFDIKLVFEYFPQILSKLPVTLAIVVFATLAGVVLGTLIALIRINKIPVLHQSALVFVSFMRGTPIIVQLFIVFFGLPVLLKKVGINANNWNTIIFVIVTYGLNLSAFMSEIIRSAITGVDTGQKEAAYSVGMTNWQTFQRIVAPQALLTAMPSFSVNIIGLLQNTSLGFTIGLVDVIGKVRAIGIRTYHVLEGYVAAAIIFIVLSMVLNKLFSITENRLQAKLTKVNR
jgi:L-cystine transport system permease protein